MKNVKKSLVLLIAVVVLLCAAVGGTVAYLVTVTGSVVNTFTPTEVTIAVVEDFSNNVKNNVKIQNTCEIPAYIRATVVVTWQDANGTVYAAKPVEGTDYAITWSKDGWTGPTNGYYYHTSPVAADGFTGILFTDCKPLKAAPAEGYTLHVEIIAEAVQSEGMGATNAQEAFSKAAQ